MVNARNLQVKRQRENKGQGKAKGKARGNDGKGEKGKGKDEILNAFPPYHHTARTHERDETISRLRGGLPKGGLTPPNLRSKRTKKHVGKDVPRRTKTKLEKTYQDVPRTNWKSRIKTYHKHMKN